MLHVDVVDHLNVAEDGAYHLNRKSLPSLFVVLVELHERLQVVLHQRLALDWVHLPWHTYLNDHAHIGDVRGLYFDDLPEGYQLLQEGGRTR